MPKFSKSMQRVSEVNVNISDAKELREELWNIALTTRNESSGALTYGASVEVKVPTVVDTVYALDLLIDMLSSKELK